MNSTLALPKHRKNHYLTDSDSDKSTQGPKRARKLDRSR